MIHRSLDLTKHIGGASIIRSGLPVISGLVFYAPLWSQRCGGSSFFSQDNYRYTCTVTEATWGVTGRTFDGVDDCINCGNGASLTIANAITLKAWMKRADTGRWQFLIAKWSDADMSYRLGFRSSDLLSFRLSISGVERTLEPAGSAITDTEWHHIVATWDGYYMKIYIDGSLNATSPEYTGTIDTTIYNLFVGKNTDGYFFKGTIGAAGINNKAFAPADVLQDYYASKWRYR